MNLKSILSLALFVLATSPALGGDVVGWRTDGTGRYPDKNPPVHWSATENILWKCPMPAASNASPVIVGPRLFACAEPTTLLCVDIKTGQVLWQRINTYLDALPAERAADLQKRLAEFDWAKLGRQLRQYESQLSKVDSDLKGTPGDAAFKARKADLEKQIADAKAKLDPLQDAIMPEPHDVVGFSTPTPVSDGTHAYVLTGAGVAACYDLDGHRRWIKLVERPTIGYGHSASPLLAGDTLILHLNSLLALKADTGEQIWSRKAEACWGTGVLAKVADDTLIITPNGEFFRLSDGQRIAKGACQLRFSQPIIEGDVVYFIEGNGCAYRLPGRNDTKLEQLWKTKPNPARRYASPVFSDGLIYTLTETGTFSAIDASNGAVIYEKNLEFKSKGLTFPSLSLAGGDVYASCEDGQTVVIKAGREFAEVGRNKLEPFRSCLVFAGSRLYIRGSKNLYCIGQETGASH